MSDYGADEAANIPSYDFKAYEADLVIIEFDSTIYYAPEIMCGDKYESACTSVLGEGCCTSPICIKP